MRLSEIHNFLDAWGISPQAISDNTLLKMWQASEDISPTVNLSTWQVLLDMVRGFEQTHKQSRESE